MMPYTFRPVHSLGSRSHHPGRFRFMRPNVAFGALDAPNATLGRLGPGPSKAPPESREGPLTGFKSR